MLNVRIPSNEIYRIGTRPAVLKSLETMLDYFNINVGQRIFFNGDSEVSKLIGGDKDGQRGSDTGIDLGYDNKLYIELEQVEAGYNDELDAYSGNKMDMTLWADPISKAAIFPKFITRRMNVTVNAIFKDRVTAQRFVTNIRSKTMSSHQNTLFDVETHYPLTETQLNCYYQIYLLLQTAGQVAPDKHFLDWMEDNATVPTGILRNAAFKAPVFVFKQCISDIGVNMENPNMAVVNNGQYIGRYEVSFRYWFYWTEHTEWIFEYPIQIYQQPMHGDYVPDVFENNKVEYVNRAFFEAAAARKVWDYQQNQEPFYHVFPTQDNWRPEPIQYLSPQLQVLLNVEDLDFQTLLNLTDINGFTWNPTVIQYLLRYASKVTRRHHNPMNIQLWTDEGRDAILVLEEQYQLDPAGDLQMLRKPRMENIYRVTIVFDYAIHLYSDDCIQDILDDLDYGRWIIGILFPNFPLPEGWGENGWADWEWILDQINLGDGKSSPFFPAYGMLYAMIVAKNSDSYNQYLQLRDTGKLNGPDFVRWDQATS